MQVDSIDGKGVVAFHNFRKYWFEKILDKFLLRSCGDFCSKRFFSLIEQFNIIRDLLLYFLISRI